jgi:hypothetical protein
MNGKPTADDILFCFSIEPNHGAETLASYIKRYPEHALDLLDLAHELRLTAEDVAEPDPEPEDETHVHAAWEVYLACGESPGNVEALFEAYEGQTFVKLARVMNVPRALLTAVRNRQVEPPSYPERFLRRLASAMGATFDQVYKYVQLPPILPSEAAFKATGKPSVQPQVPFADLVRDTPMADVQRQALTSDMV